MLTLKKEIMWRAVDDDILLLNTETGAYYSLNDMAAIMWLRLQEGLSARDIAQSIADEYEVSVERAETDLHTLIKSLIDQKIMEPSDE